MELISHTFQDHQKIDLKERLVQKKGEPRNFQESVIQFFQENIKNRQKKKYSFVFIKMRLAGCKTDLDFGHIQSNFKDIQNRRGNDAAQKYFWWATKGTDA